MKNQKTSLVLEGVHFESISLACKTYEIDPNKLHARLRYGWTYEQAFEIEKRNTECNGKVYKIWNDVNNKVYIGVTIGKVHNRFKQHLSCARNKKIYKAIPSYTKNRFR